MFSRSRSRFALVLLAGLAVPLASCRRGPERPPAIGEAFVGPAALNLRSDIPLQSSIVTTLRHGDRVEIVQIHRRFLRVRGPNGVEGWTDERQLLAAADMAALQELNGQARGMLAQGQATSFGELNVHTQAARLSPSFIQVKEGEKVDVLLHRNVPRVDLQRKSLIPPAPKKAKTAAAKKPKEPPKYPPPPMPKPPQPPANWLELSADTNLEPLPDAQEKEQPKEAAPIPTESWSLIRLANGTAGWVLTRRLVMAIPDDVAQYAEGKRIVSYFSLGVVDDGGTKKHNWLWTTSASGPQAYDFDSFRVFIWNARRHRYETAYIDRNVKGFAPVLLREVQMGGSGKSKPATWPGFSICVEKATRERVRREYAYITSIVRFAGERPCEALPPATAVTPATAPLPVAAAPLPQSGPSFSERMKARFKSMTRSLSGK